MSVNSITLGGNVGNDLEVKYTQNGKAIGSFSLAVQQGYGDNKRTMWVTCLIFGERAEKLAPHIRKGTKLVVNGRLDVRQYDRNDGTKGTAVEVAVNEFEFCSRNDQQPQQQKAPPQNNNGNYPPPDDFDPDIPFSPVGLQYGRHRIYAL
ncbi:single-stranded DNA-binding protein [Escherichia coli]|uniref:single-stranded DNA-binding protein n=1 Tax=Escherichia coli TaxID=562 RepID=UPI000BBB81FA|nr:single-stranded DNA-binding protein [Escherichia coli]EKF4266795.1 single-stranded DNA-binding protein [Escherichia coli O113]EHL2715588.1 single-stranded DNA-binding protein [Escherichia coli]EKF4500921.1 single-stranded DNA-binding protein [Escherichia coli O113]PCG29772.1 single-stranded DNA-binding protein [Escherichia coli]PCG50032.1 single-stranded DNA-binding protein [Escherichia coli]